MYRADNLFKKFYSIYRLTSFRVKLFFALYILSNTNELVWLLTKLSYCFLNTARFRVTPH